MRLCSTLSSSCLRLYHGKPHPVVSLRLRRKAGKLHLRLCWSSSAQEVSLCSMLSLSSLLLCSVSSDSTLPCLSGSTPMQSRPPSSQKGAPQKVIRTDSTARTLESMLGYAATQQNVPQATASDQEQQSRARPDPHEDQDLEMVPPSAPARTPAASRPGLHTMTSGSLPMTKCNLASIQQLRRGVENTVHHGE